MKLTTYCFSPTGTSRQNMMAVVKGLGIEDVAHRDLTLCDSESFSFIHSSLDVVIFSAPVYGGKVAPAALARMEQVRGEDTPAILLVTYGNRNFEQALSQLADFVCERGFRPIASAALVGEHSYSNATYPIAVGRPDAADLASTEEFGKRIATKLNTQEGVRQINVAEEMPRLETPESSLLAFRAFVQEYTRQQQENPVKVYPSASKEACTHCGKCVTLCPTQAITLGKEEVSDPMRCIRCCACVKGCPSGARTFLSPFAKSLSENFQIRREPLYLL